jgi:hypothetical protein
MITVNRSPLGWVVISIPCWSLRMCPNIDRNSSKDSLITIGPLLSRRLKSLIILRTLYSRVPATTLRRRALVDKGTFEWRASLTPLVTGRELITRYILARLDCIAGNWVKHSALDSRIAYARIPLHVAMSVWLHPAAVQTLIWHFLVSVCLHPGILQAGRLFPCLARLRFPMFLAKKVKNEVLNHESYENTFENDT